MSENLITDFSTLVKCLDFDGYEKRIAYLKHTECLPTKEESHAWWMAKYYGLVWNQRLKQGDKQ